jgi:hypothetical protein
LDTAKPSVLAGLASRLRTPHFEYRLFDGRPLDALRSTLASLAVRYVLEDNGVPAEWPSDEHSIFEKGLTDIQIHVLEHCDFPHLDGLIGALQTEIQGTLGSRFLAKLASISGDPRVSAHGREAASELLELCFCGADATRQFGQGTKSGDIGKYPFKPDRPGVVSGNAV